MKHGGRCLGYICTCGVLFEQSFDDVQEPVCKENCRCQECRDEREALLDRDFDEKCALAYI